MIQFFAPDIAETSSLGPEESVHCARVLRKREGDRICVTDGQGSRYDCVILKADSRKVELSIEEKVTIPKGWDYTLTLAVAPTKNADRMAWLVEKATEIGVDRILFFKGRHSERKSVNVERLKRNAISAMNQSLKTILPVIEDAGAITNILNLEGEKFVGYCDSETERLTFVKELKPQTDIVVAIGPEGDFSEEEIKELRESGYKAVTFGNERLRTETAALYAVTAAHIINEIG